VKAVLVAVVVGVLAGSASAHDRRLVPEGARLVEQWTVPAGGGAPEQIVVHWSGSRLYQGVWIWERRSGDWVRIGALPVARYTEGVLFALGDLTGDGHPEIVLQEGRGSGFCGSKFVVMTGPMRTMFRSGGCNFFLRIADGALFLSAGRYTLHDAHCCPTFTRRVRYLWTGRRMKPVGSELWWNCIERWCTGWRSGPLRFRPTEVAYWNRRRGVAISGKRPWLLGRTLDGGRRWFIADASSCPLGPLRLGKPGNATARLMRCRTGTRVRTIDYGRNWSVPQS
jgi:hypothetical protein